VEILWLIILGGLAGWIAGLIFKGSGSGIVLNVIVGILGSMIGGWLFREIGIAPQGGIGSFIAAVVGAIILLLILRAVRS
jgi:uncharacterized membrane protein YeaQ/YmgE (transglycosylase-associated protein family)